MLSIIDGRHRCAAIMHIKNELDGDRHEWGTFYIRMVFNSRRDGKEMMSGEVLKLSEKMYDGDGQSVGRRHLGHPILYNVDEEDLFIYIGALESYLNNVTRHVFHAESFYTRLEIVLKILRNIYKENANTSKNAFQDFLDEEILNKKLTKISIYQLFNNNAVAAVRWQRQAQHLKDILPKKGIPVSEPGS